MPAITSADGPVCVTGASSYVGAAIVLHLVESGCAPRGLSERGTRGNLRRGFTWGANNNGRFLTSDHLPSLEKEIGVYLRPLSGP